MQYDEKSDTDAKELWTMSGIKMVALDMDGTLLNSCKQPPVDFEDWVIAHPHIQTVLASGRQYETLRRQFPAIADRLAFIADNGSFVFRNGEMIFSDEMDHAGVLHCLQAMEGNPLCHVVLCGSKSAYMRPARQEVYDNCFQYYKKLQVTENLESVIADGCIGKIAVLVDDHRAEEVYRNLPPLHENFRVVLSGSEWLDVANKATGKGAAVEAMQRALGISRDECMAFGDYLNDCELLNAVTESYAMGNAHPALKAQARHLTDTNDNDGVMKVLRKLR